MEPREMFYANRDGSNGMPAKNTEISNSYEIVAEFFGDKKQQNREARLLLAAPELLGALKDLLDLFNPYAHLIKGDIGIEKIQAAVRAIAAAEEVKPCKI